MSFENMQKVLHRRFGQAKPIEEYDQILKKHYCRPDRSPFSEEDKRYPTIPELDILHETREEDVEDLQLAGSVDLHQFMMPKNRSRENQDIQ